MKIRIYRTRKRVPVSVHVVNLSEEALQWAEIERLLSRPGMFERLAQHIKRNK